MNDLDRLDRERRDADARYNDALTALDRAIVEVRGRALARADFDRLSTAAIVFLQQITAFVESKDRTIAEQSNVRLERAMQDLAELGTRLNVLQRAMDAIKHSGRQPPPAVGSQSAAGAPPSALCGDHDSTYLAFEDEFRGSDTSVRARVRVYVPLFTGARDVVDLGCGRGELLAALKEAGIGARGVDVNAEMVASARDRGLDAVQADAVGYLATLADGSLGGLVATQVVEHLEPPYLLRLLDLASRKLRTGAPIVLETINPACWLAFFSSYIRDFTHVRPLHPETLQYLLRANGFERVSVRYSAPVPDEMKMKTVDLPSDVLASQDPARVALAHVAHAVNANAVILNNLMFTHLDYAAIGYRS